MRSIVTAGAIGALFGSGLVISGMTQSDKVIDFLDIAHEWDPSLAFVMVGAIAVNATLHRLILKRDAPLFGGVFAIPSRTDLSPRLVAGAALFGVGWGGSGYCPGPGVVSLTSGAPQALTFVGAMLLGMGLFHVWDRPAAAASTATDA